VQERSLYLFRHGNAEAQTAGDALRGLSSEGRGEIERVGRWMKKAKLMPQQVLCSTANRTRETYDIWAKVTEYTGGVRHEQALYLAAAHGIMDIVGSQLKSLQSVMVIGHNPGLSDMVETLSKQKVHLRTGCLVKLGGTFEGWSNLKDPSLTLEAAIVDPHAKK
jgi:phosphohistidine phosphatase